LLRYSEPHHPDLTGVDLALMVRFELRPSGPLISLFVVTMNSSQTRLAECTSNHQATLSRLINVSYTKGLLKGFCRQPGARACIVCVPAWKDPVFAVGLTTVCVPPACYLNPPAPSELACVRGPRRVLRRSVLRQAAYRIDRACDAALGRFYTRDLHPQTFRPW
jgi:hypothetical protein